MTDKMCSIKPLTQIFRLSWQRTAIAEEQSIPKNGCWSFPIVLHGQNELSPIIKTAGTATGNIGPFDFAAMFKQSIGRPPQSECENSNECSSNRSYSIATVIQENKKTIGPSARLKNEEARDFGKTFFGLLFGLLALFIGYAGLKRC